VRESDKLKEHKRNMRELGLYKEQGEEIEKCEKQTWLLILLQARIRKSCDIGEQEMRRKKTALGACNWKSMEGKV
jgi:hypothetical protein